MVKLRFPQMRGGFGFDFDSDFDFDFDRKCVATTCSFHSVGACDTKRDKTNLNGSIPRWHLRDPSGNNPSRPGCSFDS